MTDLERLAGAQRKAPNQLSSKWGHFKKNPVVSFLIGLLAPIFWALVITLLINAFLLRSFIVPSGSMFQTLQVDDRILVNELVPNVIPLERGDVVVFKDPGGWLNTQTNAERNPLSDSVSWILSAFGIQPPGSAQYLVKRVIGIGGDHVVCCSANGKLTINGKEITEPYLNKGVKPSESNFDVIVPKDSIWVMGDNRFSSADSRFHLDLPSKGFVAKQFIVGRAFLIQWPFPRWAWLDNFSNVFKDIPKP